MLTLQVFFKIRTKYDVVKGDKGEKRELLSIIDDVSNQSNPSNITTQDHMLTVHLHSNEFHRASINRLNAALEEVGEKEKKGN